MNIQDVAEMAKDLLLKHKEADPTILVEMDNAHTAIILLGKVEPGEYDRAHRNFLEGRRFARKQLKNHQVIGIFFVSEILYGLPPSSFGYLKPDVKEGFVIISLDVRTFSQEVVLYDIIRSNSGELLDLFVHTSDDEETFPPGAVLPAFLAGVKTAKQDMSIAIHEFRRIYQKYAVLQ